MSKIVEEQLKKVLEADLTCFDPVTATYHIPQKKTIKLAEDCCYLFKLKPQAFTNEVVSVNWNGGNFPTHRYLKAEITSKMPNMVKVVGIGADTVESLNSAGAF